MKHIDTSGWKPFRIGDLFDVIKGSRLRSLDRKEGGIPYIGATMFNNGRTQMIGNSEHVHPGNVLTVCYNGPVGSTFYQPEPFWASDDVNVLYPKFRMTPGSGLFIAPLIEVVGRNYAYVNKWKLQDMIDSEILLPVSSTGSPDWDYMEQTMRDIEAQQERQLDALMIATKAPESLVETSDWGEFRIYELFPIVQRAKRRTINSYDDGSVPYVTNSVFNNGITGYLEPKNPEDVEKGECISVNTVNGSAFWQEHDFLANSSGNGLIMLRRKDLTEPRALFLCAAITAALNASYTVMLTTETILETVLQLPVTSTGSPDWDYMEQVVSETMAERETALDNFQGLISEVF